MERDVKGGREGWKEVSFRSFTRAIFGALFDSLSSLFSLKQHGNAFHAAYRERSGEKKTLFYFFLLFTPLLGTRLSPAFSQEALSPRGLIFHFR